jgi:hypothetical protein
MAALAASVVTTHDSVLAICCRDDLVAVSFGSSLNLLDSRSLSVVRVLEGAYESVLRASFSCDGRSLLAAWGWSVSRWAVDSGEELWSVELPGAFSTAAVEWNGRVAAASNDSHIYMTCWR